MPDRLFGVIGPRDLVSLVAETVDATANVKSLPLPYKHESETVDVVTAHTDQVDAWLFTGPVPHRMATRAGVLRLPSVSVSYSGVTLLAALIRLTAAGADISRLSIDTMRGREVTESLAAAGLPRSGLRVMRASAPDSDQVVEFHRQARREHGCTTALTCLGSAYSILTDEMPTVRLTPSPRDIREAIASLELRYAERRHADAQVVLGLLDTNGAAVSTELFVDLGATVSPLGDGTYLLVTTRGPLLAATAGLTRAPIPAQLLGGRRRARLGIGMGRSAGEAHSLARRAMARASRNGAQVAVVSTPGDADIILPVSAVPEVADQSADLSDVAARIGLRRSTLQQLRDLADATGEPGVTSADVAAALGVQERSARRLLIRLQRAAVATVAGSVSDGRTGRPPMVYRILL